MLGSAVNDSGAIVGGVTLFVLVASLAWLALDELASPPGPGRARGDEAHAGAVPPASPASSVPEEEIPAGATGGRPRADDPAEDGRPEPAEAPAERPARAGADPA